MNPRRALQIVMAVVGSALAITVVLLAISGPDSFEAGTPERAAQDFINALVDDDLDAAVALIAPASRQECRDELPLWRFDGHTGVTLIDSEIKGDVAQLSIRFDETSDFYGPFPAFESHGYEVRFRLERIDNNWLMTDGDWLFYCLRRP